MQDELRWIEEFEAAWNYDASYLRALLRVAPESFAKFVGVIQVVDGVAAPVAQAAIAA